MASVWKIASLVLLLLALSECVYRKMEKPVANIEETIKCVEADTVSFAKHIQPILSKECAQGGCHSGNNPEGSLNLESGKAYAQLWQRNKEYVDTVIAERSVLYNSLTSPANLMPPTGKLPDCHVELIAKWMRQGGRNN
jgi:hypothetical protein